MINYSEFVKLETDEEVDLSDWKLIEKDLKDLFDASWNKEELIEKLKSILTPLSKIAYLESAIKEAAGPVYAFGFI
jgi:hypothetical protein